MDTYKSENIIFSFNARINPTDKNVPDCMCILALSSSHLFVIEDNYDGTYFDHYILDINMIDKIDIYVTENSLEGPDYMMDSYSDDDAYKSVFYRLLKWLVTPRGLKKGPVPKIRTQYIEVIYHDDNFELHHLYFDEYDILPDDLIRKFEEIKNRR